jgi:hypothetical protein
LIGRHHDQHGRTRKQSHRPQIFLEVKGRVTLEQGHIGRVGQGNSQQGLTIGSSAGHFGSANLAATSRFVVNDDIDPPACAQLLPHQPGHYISQTTGREGHDVSDRAASPGVFLRPGKALCHQSA